MSHLVRERKEVAGKEVASSCVCKLAMREGGREGGREEEGRENHA